MELETFKIKRILAEALDERIRQVEVKGFDQTHDDVHDPGELASAAACYALNASSVLYPESQQPIEFENLPWWPWSRRFWKPTTARRDMIKAIALMVAEIEKLDRS